MQFLTFRSFLFRRDNRRLVSLLTVLLLVFLVTISVVVQATQARPSMPASSLIPQMLAPALTINDDTPWEQRAVWWNTSWRYRVTIDFTAGADLRDALIAFVVDWNTVLPAVGATGSVDPNSLRLVEYTAGGHIIPAYNQPGDISDLGCNRFDRLPVSTRGGDSSALWALIPNQTASGQTRHFFLYFDTTDNPKPSHDYHYLSVSDTGNGLRVERTGPESECSMRPLAVQFAGSNPVHVETLASAPAVLRFPLLEGGGPCTGDLAANAAYGIGSAIPALEMGATLTGNSGGCTFSGSSYFTTRFMMQSSGMVAILRGTIVLSPTTDLSLAPNQTLAVLSAITPASNDAWVSDGSGGLRQLGIRQEAPFPGVGTRMGARAGSTTDLRIDGLELPTAFSSAQLRMQHLDQRTLRLAVTPSQGLWRAGEPLNIRFSMVLAASSLDANQLNRVFAGTDQIGTVQLGYPAVYREDLLESQLHYYEQKGWDYVQNQLMQRGWGKEWNITYGYDIATGQFMPAHDNDSSMGAGFILYAAALRAAMTGEPEYYHIANAYANYFLALEAEDVSEHGPTVAGRISYGYNGSDNVVSFGPCSAPAHQVPDCTSIDQMTTSAMGLWQYANLDPSKVAQQDAVRALLVRMGDYMARGGPNLMAGNGLRNLRLLMGLDGSWSGTPISFPPLGFFYQSWRNHTTTSLNTGAVANAFYISQMLDRVLPHKDPGLIATRYRSVAFDTGTATRGFYPLVRGLSYPESWGYNEWEFPVVAMLKSVTNGLVSQDAEPRSYQRLVGGNRDAISGRMAEHVAVLLGAALEDPDGRMEVAGVPGPTYGEYARAGLHTIIAVLMDDQGGIRDGALGTLGNASAVRRTIQTSDFSGYALLALAEYDLLRGQVTNPMPANRFDYIQGVSERDGVTSILYLGDTNFIQRFAFPNSGWPVLGGGVIPTPTLTYRPDSTAAEFQGTTLFLPVALPANTPATGTVRQVPMVIAPESGTVQATMQAWEPGYTRLMLITAPDQRVAVRVGWLPPGTTVTLLRNGASVDSVPANSIGEAPFTIVGDGNTVTVEARW